MGKWTGNVYEVSVKIILFLKTMDSVDLDYIVQEYKNKYMTNNDTTCCYCSQIICEYCIFKTCEICGGLYHDSYLCGNNYEGKNLCNRCYLLNWITIN